MIKHYSPDKTYAKIAIPFVVFSIILAGTSVAIAGGRESYRGRIFPTAGQILGADAGIGSIESSDPYSFDPCDLEVVSCNGSEDRREGDHASGNTSSVVAGYAIRSYATLPTHEATVKAIYEAMPEIKDKFDADEYIKSKRPNSPVRGGMVERASIEYGVDMKLILALMQNDSSFGEEGKAVKTCNAGNYGNDDTGRIINFCEKGGWEAGVNAIAKWLSKHKQNDS